MKSGRPVYLHDCKYTVIRLIRCARKSDKLPPTQIKFIAVVGPYMLLEIEKKVACVIQVVHYPSQVNILLSCLAAKAAMQEKVEQAFQRGLDPAHRSMMLMDAGRTAHEPPASARLASRMSAGSMSSQEGDPMF